MNKTLCSLAITSLLLSGCAMVAKPEQANLNAQLNYNEQIDEQYDAHQDWWQVYEDKKLNQLITDALARNIDLAKSAISVNKALYQANLLGADLVPTFSGSLSASTSRDIKHHDDSTRSFGSQLGISYELDLWQRLRDSANAQEWTFKATEQDKEAARLALINSVVDSYFKLAYLKQAITITKDYIKNYEELKRITDVKFKYGKSDELEVSQAKQSLLSARNNLLNYETQQKTTEQTLRNLLNLRPDEPFYLTYPTLTDFNLSEINLDIPVAVLAKRPDLKAAEYRLLSAFKNVQAVEKSLYPSITISGAINTSAEHSDSTFKVPFGMASVSINLPFLQWNKIKWNIKSSEADYEMARLNFEQSITTALNEVDTYNFNYQQAKQALDYAQNQYQASKKIEDYRKIRYESGIDEFSLWLTAINTKLNNQLSIVNSRYEVLNSENMIYKAMAGRFIEKPIESVSSDITPH